MYVSCLHFSFHVHFHLHAINYTWLSLLFRKLPALRIFELLHDNAQKVHVLSGGRLLSSLAQKLFVAKAQLILREFAAEIIDEIEKFSFSKQCLPLREQFNHEYV